MNKQAEDNTENHDTSTISISTPTTPLPSLPPLSIHNVNETPGASTVSSATATAIATTSVIADDSEVALDALNLHHHHENNKKDEELETELATLGNTNEILSTNDEEFQHIANLYNNQKTISPPSQEFMDEMNSIDLTIKQIITRMDDTDDIDEITTLSEEGDNFQTQSREKHDAYDKIRNEMKDICTSKLKAEHASQFWLKEKRDFKKFGEWKVVLKMIEKIFPNVNETMEELGLSGGESSEKESHHGSSGGPPFKRKVKIIPAPRMAKTTKAEDDRIRHKRDWKYILEGTFNFYLKGMYT